MIVIRGHNHLRECAYIGDDSSEEEDEMQEIELEKKQKEKKEEPKETDEGVSNEPWMMKRARPSVVFHGSEQEHGSAQRLSSETEQNDNDNDGFTGPFPLKPLNDQKNKKKENAHKLARIQTEVKYKKNVNINKESSHESYLKENLPDSIKNSNFSTENNNDSPGSYEDAVNRIFTANKTLLKILKEKLNFHLDDEKNTGNEEEDLLNNQKENLSDKRRKREITLMSLHGDLTKHDEDSDHAKEEVRKIQ